MNKVFKLLLVVLCVFHAELVNSQMCEIFKNKSSNKFGLKQKYGEPESIGKTVLPAVYDDIEFRDYCGAWQTIRNGKIGFVDDWGKEMLPNIYQGILDYHAGAFFMIKDFKIGAVDRNNKTVMPFVYEDLEPLLRDAYQKMFLMEKMDFKTLYTRFFKYYEENNHLFYRQDELRKYFHNIKLNNVAIVVSSENADYKPCYEYYQNTLKPFAWQKSSIHFIFIDVSSNEEMDTEWLRFLKWGLDGSGLFPSVVYIPELNPYHLIGKKSMSEFEQFIKDSDQDDFKQTMDDMLYDYN